MAKAVKTMRYLPLTEVVTNLQATCATIAVYTNSKAELEMVLSKAETTTLLFDTLSDLKLLSAELMKRFNAPSHYDD